MKLKWKGILSKTNPFPSPAIPANAKDLFKGYHSRQVYMLIIPILLGAYLCILLKRPFATEALFSKAPLFLGAGLSLLFLSVHELIHAICCPKKSEILLYVTVAGLCMIPTCPLRKHRYIAISIMPAIVLGICPLCAWLCLPGLSPLVSSIVFAFSLGSLGACIGDINNAILAAHKMTSTSLLITSGSSCYYYETSA